MPLYAPLPWNLDALRASVDSNSTLVAAGIHLTIMADMRLRAWLEEVNLKEYYNNSLEVDVQIHRPVNSDYNPYVAGTIFMVIAGRDKTSGAVKICRTVLATLTSDKYADSEEESRIREVALALLDSDTLVVRWWITMLNPQMLAPRGIPLADKESTEQARTDAILAIMDEARGTLKARQQDNPRKGAGVKVVRGRKVPIGTEGKLFWIGNTQFGKRIGFKDANDVVHWTAWGNFEITDPIDESEVIALAKQLYEGRGYAKMFGKARN